MSKQTFDEKIDWQGFVLDVITHLGPGWQMIDQNSYDNRVDVVRENGSGFSIHSDRGRLFIRALTCGLWEYRGKEATVPEISVNATRTAKDVSQEITRRLLPPYAELWDLMVAGKQRHDEREAAADANAQRLIDIAPELLRLREWGHSRHDLTRHISTDIPGLRELRVYSDKDTSATLNLDIDAMERVIRAILGE